MAKYTYQQKLTDTGYCDERGAGFCASATCLPGGEYGLVTLCVKGNIMNIYDTDMRGNLGELLYKVELKNIKNLKIRMLWVFSQVLKFEYEGCVYSFTNFLGVKPALAVIEEESKRS